MLLAGLGKFTFWRNLRRGLPLLFLFPLVVQATAIAGKPEYMRLDYEKIPAVEVKGYWDEEGSSFIVTDIEELPKARRPKLRGEIQAVDHKTMTIVVYGVWIKLDTSTQFLETGGEKYSIDKLRAGQRIEVSCKVDENGLWKGRKIKVGNVKKSNKIKGTITDIAVDGNPPDTLEIHGLLIILTRDTDVNEPTTFFDRIEEKLFDDLVLTSAASNFSGMSVGRRILFNGDYRQTVRSELEYDLRENISSNHNDTEPEIRLKMTGYWNMRFRTVAQLRMRKKYFIESERQNPPSRDLDAHLTQLYLLARDLGTKGLTLQIGRQDFDEPREWLFDEYLDALRLYYYGKVPIVLETALIHSTFQIKEKYRTWTDIFGQVSWYLNKNNRLRGYYLLRKDSDEARNREPVWWGLGFYGKIRNTFRPWVEMAVLRGQDKGKTLQAAALDAGATFNSGNYKSLPSLTIAYAIGTGDKNSGDQISNEFRQTGYEDNVDYYGGVNSLRYYGEVLNPELSNLKIFTLALGLKPLKESSFEVVYHSYRQHYPDDKLRGKLIDPPARPNGVSDHIGWEVDLVAGLSKLWQRAYLTWTFGFFNPGEAFPLLLENATINKINLKIAI